MRNSGYVAKEGAGDRRQGSGHWDLWPVGQLEIACRASRPFADDGVFGFERITSRQLDSANDQGPDLRRSPSAELQAEFRRPFPESPAELHSRNTGSGTERWLFGNGALRR